MAPMELLPVTVLSGFLGAGKTTLLKHVLRLAGNPQAAETAAAAPEAAGPLKVAVLVNDMGEVNLDASEIKSSRLIQEEATMVEMHNGCICCTLRGDLLKTVKALSEEQAFDYLVIESTGISEPLPVAQTFTMDVDGGSHSGPPAPEGFRSLSHFAKLDTLVTVVDALNIYDVLGSLETLAEQNMTSMLGNTGAERGEDQNVDNRSIAQLMLEQIEFANVIVLSKAHLSPAVSEIRALLQRLNPGATVLVPEKPHFGDVPLSAVINTGLFDMEAAQKSSLWAAELAKEEGHLPETLEYGISSVVFRRHDRPFHHERVKEVLKSCGNYGSAATKQEGASAAVLQGVVRAKGQLWVVPCEYPIGVHIAGRHCEVHVSKDLYLAAVPESVWDDEGRRRHKELLAEGRWHAFGDRESEVIFIGVHLDRSRIVRALEGALLTDEELAVWKEQARARAEAGEVRMTSTVSSLTEAERLLAIWRDSCGEAHGSEFVSIPGYESLFTRRQLHEYVHGLKVMDDFPVPRDIPFHVFIAKSAGGKACVLQDVRVRTGVSVRVVREDNMIVFGGLFSTVVNAKRELQAFLDSFVARTLCLEGPQLEHVSKLGKTSFPKMENFRHLTAAQINRERQTLLLSGAPDAVAEAHSLVEDLFREKGWVLSPQAEP